MKRKKTQKKVYSSEYNYNTKHAHNLLVLINKKGPQMIICEILHKTGHKPKWHYLRGFVMKNHTICR